MLRSKFRIFGGFTLVELLVAITILGVLATVGLSTFTSAQARGRDTQRKSDLKQIVTALELYYSDHETYPASNSGKIAGCPSTTSTACVWGGSPSEFTDTKTSYFKNLPKDPFSNYNYYYRTVSVNAAVVGFQLYARLENPKDIDCLGGNCGSPPALPGGFVCGAYACNFAITSPNVTPTQN
jgi:type II secretion system protein G